MWRSKSLADTIARQSYSRFAVIRSLTKTQDCRCYSTSSRIQANSNSSSSSGSLADRLKDKASQALQSTRKRVQEESIQLAQKTKDKAISAAQSATHKTIQHVTKTTQTVLQQTKDVASQQAHKASQQVIESVEQSATKVSESAVAQSREAVQGVQSVARRATKWFFVWSLAAIFVYGFATSLPRELLRHFSWGETTTDSSSKNDTNDAGDGQGEGDKGSKSWWSFGGPTTKKR